MGHPTMQENDTAKLTPTVGHSGQSKNEFAGFISFIFCRVLLKY